MPIYLPATHDYTIYETREAAEAAAEVDSTVDHAHRMALDANGAVHQTDLGWVVIPPAQEVEDAAAID